MVKNSLSKFLLQCVMIGYIICFTTDCHAQKWSLNLLPPLPVLFETNDSIIREGHRLYFYEKMGWNVTDFLFTNHKIEEVGGSLIYMSEDSLMTALFIDKGLENTICELQWDMKTGKYTPIDSCRPLTIKEQELHTRKNVMLEKMNEVADSINGIPQGFGQFNFDFIRINENITRMYILTGTVKPNIIPFGNDYSIDYDNDNRIVAFRRYHKSLIAIPTDLGNDEVSYIMHSHTLDNPFITPTDICNYLLYARDVFGMKMFSVYSPKFKTTFLYSDEDKAIVTIGDSDKKKKKEKKPKKNK